jgi:hypothetical protein
LAKSAAFHEFGMMAKPFTRDTNGAPTLTADIAVPAAPPAEPLGRALTPDSITASSPVYIGNTKSGRVGSSSAASLVTGSACRTGRDGFIGATGAISLGAGAALDGAASPVFAERVPG